jgi:hypothetical protein
MPALLDPWTTRCRYCGAAAGEQCRNQITSAVLRKGLAHPMRIRDAYPDLEPKEDEGA